MMREASRCRKDLIEEELFRRNRDLFSELELVFFDTTSLYFEGNGGESLGQYGHSKDHRPDLKQMVVGAVLDGTGRPICCELWPGNLTDVTSLIPVVAATEEPLRHHFGVRGGRPRNDQRTDDRRNWKVMPLGCPTSWERACTRTRRYAMRCFPLLLNSRSSQKRRRRPQIPHLCPCVSSGWGRSATWSATTRIRHERMPQIALLSWSL